MRYSAAISHIFCLSFSISPNQACHVSRHSATPDGGPFWPLFSTSIIDFARDIWFFLADMIRGKWFSANTASTNRNKLTDEWTFAVLQYSCQTFKRLHWQNFSIPIKHILCYAGSYLLYIDVWSFQEVKHDKTLLLWLCGYCNALQNLVVTHSSRISTTSVRFS